MRFVAFRVQNYRSINDSGWVQVHQRTALVGRNESGKTSLLLALQSLNPAGSGIQPLSYVKDFPRDRPASAFSDGLTVVDTQWELSPTERSELAKVFPRSRGVTEVTVARSYKAQRTVGFTNLARLTVDVTVVQAGLTIVEASTVASLAEKDAATSEAVREALKNLNGVCGTSTDKPVEWGTKVLEATQVFRQALATVNHPMTPDASQGLTQLEGAAKSCTGDDEAAGKGRRWIVDRLPLFIYLAEYPDLQGHQDIPAYVARLKSGQALSESDKNFGKLLKVAGLNAEELNELLNGDHEKRQQLANRAGAVVTKKLRELWKDRRLKVRFNLDAGHFDTLVSDPEAVYDVEINLNERSRGLKWFFSFYVTFAADTAAGPAENAVLLFDEPALYLHAVAQQDLLEHFKKDFRNTIIYTTHSPWMIPVDDLGSVRTVSIAADTGTQVANSPAGDSQTMFPLQTALGYDLSQNLFIGNENLVVEGVSDYWYLIGVSERLKEEGGDGLPTGLVVTPAGGAQKVPYMVSLLASQKLKVLVLLDSEGNSRRSALEDLIKSKLIREDGVVFVGDALEPEAAEADIEDLIDPAVYAKLVQEAYAKELVGKSLALNDKVPRIAKRYDEAFGAIGLQFNKTRPARSFLNKVAQKPDEVLTPLTRTRFGRLFKTVRLKAEGVLQRQVAPFR